MNEVDNQPPAHAFRAIIYRVPLLGDVAYFLAYAIGRPTMGLVMRLKKYERITSGTCTVWAPPRHIECIMAGIEFLRTHDSEMFSRLTTENKLIICYCGDGGSGLFLINLFGIYEAYIRWGPGAVASYFVLTLLQKEICHLRSPFRLSDEKRAEMKAAIQKMTEWAKRNSVRDDFIAACYEMPFYL